jgi:uncharacterized membrane protein YvbJ
MHCNHCRKELEKDMISCPECGTKVKNEVTGQNLTAGEEKGCKKKKLLIIAGTVTCLFVISLVVFLFLDSGKKENDKQGMILSILVDTFFARISMPKQQYPEIHNISAA